MILFSMDAYKYLPITTLHDVKIELGLVELDLHLVINQSAGQIEILTYDGIRWNVRIH